MKDRPERAMFFGPFPIEGVRRASAPAHAPYPSTVPLGPGAPAETPWWSEKLLLRHLGDLALLRMYTHAAPILQ